MTSDRGGDSDVTVVIPCYNQGQFLSDSVGSALAQTLGRPRVIVVDDGSSDDTPTVAASMDVEYVRQRNSGPSAARNRGLTYVTSDYVVFLDADDMLHPRHNELCRAALVEHPQTAYAYTQWREFGCGHETSSFPAFDPRSLLQGNYIHISSLFRTRALHGARFDDRLRRWGIEDWDLYLTLLGHRLGGVLVDEPLLLYRVGPHGRMHIMRTRPLEHHAACIYLAVKHRRLYGWQGTMQRLAQISGWIWQYFLAALRRRYS